MLLHPDHTSLPGADLLFHPPSGNSRRRRCPDQPCVRASANGRKPVPVPLELQYGARNLEEFNTSWVRFRHRKTLFKVNTGIPPSSCRNVEPTESELSCFSEKLLLSPAPRPAPGCTDRGTLCNSLPAMASSAPDLEKQKALLRGEGLLMLRDFPFPSLQGL